MSGTRSDVPLRIVARIVSLEQPTLWVLSLICLPVAFALLLQPHLVLQSECGAVSARSHACYNERALLHFWLNLLCSGLFLAYLVLPASAYACFRRGRTATNPTKVSPPAVPAAFRAPVPEAAQSLRNQASLGLRAARHHIALITSVVPLLLVTTLYLPFASLVSESARDSTGFIVVGFSGTALAWLVQLLFDQAVRRRAALALST